ncbi:MFS transporter [Corynebacterium meridianum]|uniref:MHS family MFS transporter n=1 Tax=Corynebacterium meridianum TaxID=2765363 RepID=A0A934I500_9CORY|nr:MFS transporter [Corynebacterium meridianum]MBI8988650.1 MHS family MFS transporter [Corynebacterium meridianum]MCK7677120.1 MHS family MFS transporter [Corynebacterium meridianum]
MTTNTTTREPKNSFSGPLTKEHKKVLAGSMVGTTVEWFDFFIYAQAAGLIFASQFFNPAGNNSPTLAQIISWASLGLSFLVRPLGAVVAGHIGDRKGRKFVLTLTLLGMGGATVAIGFLPTYEQIGMAAPLLLIGLRLLQGFSAGGEWGGAALLAVEHAPVNRRGYFGSFPQVGVPCGMILATLFMLVLTKLTTPAQFEDWGWRIPFLSSVVMIIIGYLIRKMCEESPVFAELEKLQKESSAPLKVLFSGHKKPVMLCAMIFAADNAAGYLAIAFFSSYGAKVLGMPRSTVLFISLAGAVSWTVATIFYGALSDRVGRRTVFTWGYIIMALFAVPMWMMIDTANVFLFGLAVVILGQLLGATYGPQAALYAEMFPAKVRLSGISIGYAIGSIIGGAFAPMIAQLLLNKTGTSMSIGVYLILISLFSLWGVRMVNPKVEKSSLH